MRPFECITEKPSSLFRNIHTLVPSILQHFAAAQLHHSTFSQNLFMCFPSQICRYYHCVTYCWHFRFLQCFFFRFAKNDNADSWQTVDFADIWSNFYFAKTLCQPTFSRSTPILSRSFRSPAYACIYVLSSWAFGLVAVDSVRLQ